MDALNRFIRNLGKIKEVKKDGNVVFDLSNLTLEDMETIKHVRLNLINGQIFDDRCAKL